MWDCTGRSSTVPHFDQVTFICYGDETGQVKILTVPCFPWTGWSHFRAVGSVTYFDIEKCQYIFDLLLVDTSNFSCSCFMSWNRLIASSFESATGKKSSTCRLYNGRFDIVLWADNFNRAMKNFLKYNQDGWS